MTGARFATRALAVLPLMIGLLLAIIASLALGYQALKATSRIGLLVAVIMISFFICSLLVTSIATKLWKTSFRRLPLRTSAALLLVFGSILFITFLRSFLLDQAPTFPTYQGDRDPRPPIPAARH